jgi:hypothetical protein
MEDVDVEWADISRDRSVDLRDYSFSLQHASANTYNTKYQFFALTLGLWVRVPSYTQSLNGRVSRKYTYAIRCSCSYTISVLTNPIRFHICFHLNTGVKPPFPIYIGYVVIPPLSTTAYIELTN